METVEGITAAWQVETDVAVLQPRSVLSVLEQVDRKVRAGELDGFQPLATGFTTLDQAIGGGVRLGELILVGGAQGVGKTTFVFQIARNLAASSQAAALYVCYEHDEEYLLSRLLSLESIDPTNSHFETGLRLKDLRRMVVDGRARGEVGLFDILKSNPKASGALAKLQNYGSMLYILKGSAAHTTLPALSGLVDAFQAQSNRKLVLCVDYLQKVPVYPELPEEAEKVTRIVEGLKELALTREIPIIAIVAADKEGLKARRLHLHHLRGSSALTYEADIILILNDKYNIITKTNIEFNTHKAQGFKQWVVVSLEKNRGGRDLIDLEFQKRFEYSCLNPEGGMVAEQLIDERVFKE